MDYSFNGEIAKLYGVDEAVFIHNLYWWIAKNEANGRHYYDGRNWTYNSMDAFARLFPFWSARQVRRIVKKLYENGAIHIGNYNQRGFDRTQWYALDQSVTALYQIGDSIRPNSQMEVTEQSNGSDQTVRPIPDSKPDSKPDINTDTEKTSCKQISELFNSTCKSYASVTKLSESRKKAIKARLADGYILDDFQTLFAKAEASDFLRGMVKSKGHENWKATFDWLITDRNMPRVIEGVFDNKAKQSSGSLNMELIENEGLYYVPKL